jgi:predicted transcriptional regulator
VTTQTWFEEGQIINDKAMNGVKLYSLLGYNTILPRNIIHELVPLARKLIHEGKIESRLLENVRIGICIADGKRAGLMFPNKDDGEADMNTLFVSDDSMFCEWCTDVFDHFWQIAIPSANVDKLKTVDIQ